MGNDDRHCHIFHISPTSVLVEIVADHDLVHYLRLSGHQKPLIGHEIQSLWAKGMWEEHHLSQWSLNVSPGRQQTQWSHHSPWISSGPPTKCSSLVFLTDIRICTSQPVSLQQKWINSLFTVTGYCYRLGLIRHLFTEPEINHSRVDGM